MRPKHALVVLLVSLGVLGSCIPISGAQATTLAITDVRVGPHQPVPSEEVTVTVTVQNRQNSPSAFDIESVTLQEATGDDPTEYAQVDDLGQLAPGASIDVPVTTSFEDSGTKHLAVVVDGENENGTDRRLEYPVTIYVRDDHPSVDLSVEQPTVGVETNATVTVANGLNRSIHNVEVTLTGPFSAEQYRQATSRIAPGKNGEFTFTVQPTEAAEQTVTAEVTYTVGSGVTRQVTAETTFDVTAAQPRVVLDPSRHNDTIAVRVTNLGNAPIENVLVTGRANNTSIDQAVLFRLDPGTTRTVNLSIADLTNTTTVTIGGTYDQAGETLDIDRQSVRVPVHPGRIELTGLNTEPGSNGTLQITGTASNVGLTAANSVIVRVRPSQGVTPAPPNREYFVGTVPASDFVSFDLSATVDENATALPVEVTYLSNGVERTDLVSIPLTSSAPAAADTSAPGSGIGPLAVAAIGVLLVLVVGAIMYVGWRNRDRASD